MANKKKPGEGSGIEWMVIDSNVFAYVSHPHQFKVEFRQAENRFELYHGAELVGDQYKSFAELDSAARRIIVGDLNNHRGA